MSLIQKYIGPDPEIVQYKNIHAGTLFKWNDSTSDVWLRLETGSAILADGDGKPRFVYFTSMATRSGGEGCNLLDNIEITLRNRK